MAKTKSFTTTHISLAGQKNSQPGHQHQDYGKQIARQQLKIAELEAIINHLRARLDKQQAPKQQIKDLFASVDNAIMRSIDKKGYAKKPRKTMARFPTLDISGQSKEGLLIAARSYDAKQYFQYQGLHENMKPHYRAASKLYRTTRDITKKGAKKGYKLAKRDKG